MGRLVCVLGLTHYIIPLAAPPPPPLLTATSPPQLKLFSLFYKYAVKPPPFLVIVKCKHVCVCIKYNKQSFQSYLEQAAYTYTNKQASKQAKAKK